MTILKYTFLFLAIFAPALLTGQAYFTVKNAPAKAKKAYDSGREAMQAGDIAGAIRYYRKAVEIEPTFVDAWSDRRRGPSAITTLGRREIRLRKSHHACARLRRPRFNDLLRSRVVSGKICRKAAAHAQAYLLSNPKNENAAREARRMAENAAFAAEAVRHPRRLTRSRSKAPSIRRTKYFPLLSANGVIFTRNDGKTA